MWTWNTTRAAVLACSTSYSSVETTSQTINGSTTEYSDVPVGSLQSTVSMFSSQTQSGVGGTTQTSSFEDYVVYQNQTFGSTESGTVAGRSFASTGPVNSSSSSSTFTDLSALTSGQTIVSSGGTNAYTSVDGTDSTTFFVTFSNPSFSITYPWSTSATTTNIPVTTTETSSAGFTFPNTATTSSSSTTTTTGVPSTTTTTTTALTTALSSTSYSATVSVTSTATFNTTVNSTSSAPNQWVILDTVVSAESTDWLWLVTTTGTGDPTAKALSFTQTTVSFTFGSASVYVALYTIPAVPSTVTFTSASNYQSTTVSSTTEASSSSTYAVGVVPTATTTTYGSTTSTTVAAALPLTSTASKAITFLTTQTTTLSYCSQQTTSDSVVFFTAAGATFVSTRSDGTYVTTNAAGTLTSSITYTVPATNQENQNGSEIIFVGDGNYSSSQSFGLINGTSMVTVTNSTTQIASGIDVIGQTFVAASSFASGVQAGQTFTASTDPGGVPITFQSMLNVTDATISPGWQATPSSFGADNSVGTNISGPASMEATGSGWPSVSLAVPTGTETYILTGTVPTTDVNQLSTTAFGGFDWISTTSTKGTLTVGILRITTCDSFSNTGTTESTFDTVHSTYSIASGQGIAAETVPAVYSASSSQEPNPFVAFPAFPVTT